MFLKTEQVENTRQYRRMQADYLLKFRPADTGAEESVTNVRDLSAGGLRFWTDLWLSEGQALEVSFLLPPVNLLVEARARIVRVRRADDAAIFYVAVVFESIPNEDRAAIDRFIDALSRKRGARSIVDHHSRAKRIIPEPYVG